MNTLATILTVIITLLAVLAFPSLFRTYMPLKAFVVGFLLYIPFLVISERLGKSRSDRP